jgi:hypothetical protein
MIKKILLVLFVGLSICLNAQNNGATIQVFHPNQQQGGYQPVTKAHKDSMRYMDKNSIKWNWSLLTRGVFLINYERYIGGNFSIEIGAGLTYRDFLFEFTKSLGGDTIKGFSGNTDISDFGSASPKECGEAGLRYYPSGYDNMEGVYLEATVSYRSYSFPNPTYQPVVGGSGYVPGYNFLDEQFKFGYVASSWASDITGEFYVGIGWRNATVNTYEDATYLVNYTPVYGYKPITLHLDYPQFLLGFKLNYSF